MLWIDKYRPTSLDQLDYHTEQAERLKNMVRQGDFPHLLVYGPPGAGKKTRIMCILKELYGNGVEKIKSESMHFEAPSKKKLEIDTVSSNYHIEVNPSDVGIYDRVIVMELVKTTAQTHLIDPNGLRQFKVVFLTNVDNLTKDAQHALRRTMEKYVGTCRLILCSNSTSRVMPAIRSRCLGIRVPAPTIDEIKSILQFVAGKEKITLPDELARRIAEASDRNVRRAVLMLETCHVEKSPLTVDQNITEPDWQSFIKQIANIMVTHQTPRKLLEIRGKFYELLTHAIPTDLIFKVLLKEVAKNCDLELKIQVATVAAEYEHRMHKGSKIIFHLEAFAARFMTIYRKFLDANQAGFDVKF